MNTNFFLRWTLVAVLLTLGSGMAAWADPPLTKVQQEKLKERDSFGKQSQQFALEGKLLEAIGAGEKVLTIERSVLGSEHPEVVETLKHLAALRESVEDFAAAEKNRRELLRLLTKKFGDKSWQATDARLNLQYLDARTRMDARTRKELKAADQWLEQAGDPFDAGKYPEAAKLVAKGCAIYRKILGDNHFMTAISLNAEGMVQFRGGEYTVARRLYEQALAIRREVLGDNHPDTAGSLNNLGILMQDQGDYGASRTYYNQALAIYKKTLGDDHPDTATCLNNLGLLLFHQGDYAAARACYDQSLAIRKKVLGDDHLDTAVSLNNLGFLLYEQGDNVAARSFLEQALAINKKVLGDDHLQTATYLNNLGLVLEDLEDYAAARTCHDKSLAIRKKVLKDNHPDIAVSLHNLGSFLFAQEDYAAARPYFDQALAIKRKVLGDNHPSTCGTLFNLGVLLSQEGDYAAARPYFDQALAKRKKTLGPHHPDVALSLNGLGTLLAKQDDFARARAYCEEALFISRRNLNLSAAGQSERQQLLMANMVRHQLDNLLSAPGTGPAAGASDYVHVLAWKGSILARQQRMRLARVDPKYGPLFQNLRSTTEALATHSAAIPDDPKALVAWTKQLQEMSERQESLERELAAKSAKFREDQAQANLTSDELLKALPADTALVDFLVYQHHLPDPKKKGKRILEQRLTAFVLRPGAAVVRLDMGPMGPIEKAIDQWRLMVKQPPGKDHPGMELRRRLWLPLEKHLAGVKLTLLSPDGALGRLPFVALPGSKEGSYLLEEVALSVVPVPRLLPELLRRENVEEKGSPPSLLLVGDVNFDASPGASDADQSAAAPTRTGRSFKWAPLAGTRTEIVAIRDSFESKHRKGKISVLREEEATDAAVREEAGKHRFLHIATHGFFAAAEVRSALGDVDGKRGPSAHDAKAAGGFHPGLLSGLVLGGANKPPQPGQSDGILTALEVAELDLSKVELAVLSACDTGLGKVAGGEGVLGLQRSFQVAGARSVVSSLWKVPDDQTSKLMTRFYANLWHKTKPMSKLEALREAQLYMLREGRTRGLVEDDEKDVPRVRHAPPYHWAAFVLSGDWR